MKFLIALASFLYVQAFDISSSGTACTCSKLNFQNDCNAMNEMCTWSGSACANINCTAVTSYSTCAAADTCAWVNNTCQTFTKCSDYSSTTNATCSVQGSGCNTSTTANSTTSGFNCMDTTSTSMAACTTYTTNTTCMSAGLCTWSNSTCRITACSDFTSSSTCTITSSADYKTIKICAWGTACTEATSLNLNSTTCFAYTGNMYYWNSATNTCTSCSANSIILIAGLLSALFI